MRAREGNADAMAPCLLVASANGKSESASTRLKSNSRESARFETSNLSSKGSDNVSKPPKRPLLTSQTTQDADHTMPELRAMVNTTPNYSLSLPIHQVRDS
jgi:hypothetical protein